MFNEFPLMGGRLAPPLNELLSPHYAAATPSSNGSTGLWRNFFENPTTVQFDHRVLATTTYIAAALLFASSRRAAVRAALPPLALGTTTALFAMANMQVLLGISTLLYLVPVPLAAAHQAGSVMLLTTALHVLLALRRPGTAALAWRQANLARRAEATTAAREKPKIKL
jgi:cytochrome c oxidase assembly protein subunit 15